MSIASLALDVGILVGSGIRRLYTVWATALSHAISKNYASSLRYVWPQLVAMQRFGGGPLRCGKL